VIATEATLLSDAIEKPYQAAYFTINVKRFDMEDIENLSFCLRKHVGKQTGYIKLIEDRCETLVYLGDDLKLDLAPALKKEAEQILGVGSIQFV
jgi:DNA polymerase-3 subunit alpha